MKLILRVRAIPLQVLQTDNHRHLRGIDLLDNFAHFLTDKELMGAEAANFASHGRLTSAWVLGSLWVVSCSLSALFVVRVAAECAETHLVAV